MWTGTGTDTVMRTGTAIGKGSETCSVMRRGTLIGNGTGNGSKRCVHGFVPKRGIITNAGVHTGKRFVINLDLKDFFPSIHIGRVIGALSS